MKRYTVFVALVLLVTVTACSTAAPGAEQPVTRAALDLELCPLGFDRVDLVPDRASTDAAELSKLLTCRNDQIGQGYVKNYSDQVWLIDSPVGLQWSDRAPTASAAIYRQALFALAPVIGPVPGLPVEPGTQAYFGLPWSTGLHLTLDSRLQAMWHAQEAVTEKIVARGQNEAVRALSRDGTTRRSVLTCGLSGYRIGETLAGTGSGTEERLKTLLDVGGDTSDCGRAIWDVETEAFRTGSEPLVTRRQAAAVTRSPKWLQTTQRALGAAVRGLGTLR